MSNPDVRATCGDRAVDGVSLRRVRTNGPFDFMAHRLLNPPKGRNSHAVRELFIAAENENLIELSLSDQAKGMAASQILVIAYAVKDAIARGENVANFTVGDFSPKEFQIPALLKASIMDAVRDDQTNYPPANGTPELRAALKSHYERRLNLSFPLDSFVVASGARPVLYATYQCLINRKRWFHRSSWNTNFCQLVGATHVTVPTTLKMALCPRWAPWLQ